LCELFLKNLPFRQVFYYNLFEYVKFIPKGPKMKRNDRKILIFLVLAVGFLVSVDSFASVDNAIISELKRLQITTVGSPRSVELLIPEVLSGPNWGLTKIICDEGGYDLSASTGKKMIFTAFPIREKWRDEPLDVWIITDQQKIVCVYKAVREGSNAAPGIFSVKNLEPEPGHVNE
jgi:hypothetical protein